MISSLLKTPFLQKCIDISDLKNKHVYSNILVVVHENVSPLTLVSSIIADLRQPRVKLHKFFP